MWDDSEDRALLYEEDLLKLVNANHKPEVVDKVLLRKQLRCMHQASVNFQVSRPLPRRQHLATTYIVYRNSYAVSKSLGEVTVPTTRLVASHGLLATH